MKEINLLPEEYIQQRNDKKKRKNIIIAVLSVVLILLVFYLYLYFLDDNIKKEISNNTSRMKELTEVEEIQRQIDLEEKTFENRVIILESLENQRIKHNIFLENIDLAVPREVVLENIIYSSDNNFSIKGKTGNPSSIADFMMNISEIKDTSNITLDNIQYASNSDVDKKLSFFSIQFSYKAEGGEKHDVNK